MSAPVHAGGGRTRQVARVARVPARAPAGAHTARPTARPGGHLRVVGSSERRRRHLGPVVGMAVTIVVFVGLFALAGAHTLLVEGQVRLDRINADLAAERARYQELRLAVAELEAPHRVVAAAQERLGMVPPHEIVYLTPPVAVPAPLRERPRDPVGEPGGPGEQTWAAVRPLPEAAVP